MTRAPAARIAFALSLALVTLAESAAHALDKQGSAHGGSVAGAEEGVGLSGSLLMGVALYNPSYAARPDNTGEALMRYALHGDLDLVGRRLSIPLDLNFFSDRTRRGALVFSPTELDIISGLTTTWSLGEAAAVELGLRFEHDRPVDREGFSQTYVDFRNRFLFSFEKMIPGLADALRGGDLTSSLTFGTFLVNPTYAARPDNTGLALFRYTGHLELSVFDDHLALASDATFFTNRESRHFAPSELDYTTELVGRLAPFELHLAYERDMPVDRGGLVQELLLGSFVYGFDFASSEPAKAPREKLP